VSYIFGHHAVISLFESHPKKVLRLYIQSGKNISELKKYIDALNLQVVWRSKEELGKLTSSDNHQGIVAEVTEIAATPDENDLERILNAIEGVPLLLILDGIQDPHNLGACLRTANAANVHAVIAPKDKSVGLTPVVHKVASGATMTTPFIQVTNLARTMRMLKERGIWIFGADDKATESVFAADLNLPLALAMGAEGSGLRRLTKENCDLLLSIPMLGTVPSLNVSVATGIFLFEAVRQRLKN